MKEPLRYDLAAIELRVLEVLEADPAAPDERPYLGERVLQAMNIALDRGAYFPEAFLAPLHGHVRVEAAAAAYIKNVAAIARSTDELFFHV